MFDLQFGFYSASNCINTLGVAQRTLTDLLAKLDTLSDPDSIQAVLDEACDLLEDSAFHLAHRRKMLREVSQ